MTAFYVTTGGPVPSYYDAVLPIEETELSPDKTKIKVTKQMNKDQFIRPVGSDIKQG